MGVETKQTRGTVRFCGGFFFAGFVGMLLAAIPDPPNVAKQDTAALTFF